MKYDDDRDSRRERIADRLTFLLIGGGVGAILALLFAPKSGQELRGDIADATRKGIDRSRQAAYELRDKAGEYYRGTGGRVAEIYPPPALPGDEDFIEPGERPVGQGAGASALPGREDFREPSDE